MNNSKLHFALWAEDIGQYLHTGYNSKTLTEIESSLREYVSIDESENERYGDLNILNILQMTGLSLDYSESAFHYRDGYMDRTQTYRIGNTVPNSFLQ